MLYIPGVFILIWIYIKLGNLVDTKCMLATSVEFLPIMLFQYRPLILMALAMYVKNLLLSIWVS